jgi:hypothetical protein
MYILTDESMNNLYTCGSDTKMLGLGTTTSTSTLQRITYLNKKVNKILCNGKNWCELITEEPSNNIFYINNILTTNNFTRLNDPILYDKKIIDGDCNDIFRYKITDEPSNNLYVIGGNSSYTNLLGLGSGINTVSSYTKISDYSTSLSNKKVEKIYMSFNLNNVFAGPFVLTDETSNNLYACGNNSSIYTYTLGIGNTIINKYEKVSNYSTVLLNKKVIEVNATCIDTYDNVVSLLTNESSNNLYSTGLNNYLFGESVMHNTALNTTNLYTFKNVSKTQDSEILNKKVKLIKGSYRGLYDEEMAIAITDELPTSLNSNIYVVGHHNSIRYAWDLDKTLKYFKKMKYPLLNKKFIKIDRTDREIGRAHV